MFATKESNQGEKKHKQKNENYFAQSHQELLICLIFFLIDISAIGAVDSAVAITNLSVSQ